MSSREVRRLEGRLVLWAHDLRCSVGCPTRHDHAWKTEHKFARQVRHARDDVELANIIRRRIHPDEALIGSLVSELKALG